MMINQVPRQLNGDYDMSLNNDKAIQFGFRKLNDDAFDCEWLVKYTDE